MNRNENAEMILTSSSVPAHLIPLSFVELRVAHIRSTLIVGFYSLCFLRIEFSLLDKNDCSSSPNHKCNSQRLPENSHLLLREWFAGIESMKKLTFIDSEHVHIG